MTLAAMPSLDACAEPSSLISVEEAIARVRALAPVVNRVRIVQTAEAVGSVLARSVRAEIDQPLFDQSAMDGYALLAGDGLQAGLSLTVAARCIAGDAPLALGPDNAVRTFTGGPIPVGADCVVMQEHGVRFGDVFTLGRPARAGENIRRRGEDVRQGDLILDAGTRLDARHVALLAAQGLAEVCVRDRLRVTVVSTGNELRREGEELDPGAIYDTNGPMLLALARSSGLETTGAGLVRDDPQTIAALLAASARAHDLVLTSGGASVGEEDHTSAAIRLAGGTCETLRIALKPGKPAVVGRLGSCLVLGLPGNPVSALVSFMLLGGAAMRAMQGHAERPRLGFELRTATAFLRRPGRREFAPARLTSIAGRTFVEIIGRGGSARLRPLAEADGLVEIAPEHAPVEAGDAVIFHPFSSGSGI